MNLSMIFDKVSSGSFGLFPEKMIDVHYNTITMCNYDETRQNDTHKIAAGQDAKKLETM